MSKQEFAIIALGFLLLFGGIYYFTQCPNGQCVSGGPGIVMRDPTSFEDCVSMGHPVMESYPRQCRAPNGTVFTEKVEEKKEVPPEEIQLKLIEPANSASVGLPAIIKGESRVAGQVNYRVRDIDGTVLAEGFTTVTKTGSGEFSPFEVSAMYPETFGDRGSVEIYTLAEKDGAEANKVTVPVMFQKVETQDLMVSFLNLKLDPDREQCDVTSPYKRRIPKSDAPERIILEDLLKGPTPADIKKGASTAIPEGVVIKSFALANGTITVDFNDALTKNIVGTCRAAAIRAQIMDTLLQFPDVEDVVISVNGETKNVLK